MLLDVLKRDATASANLAIPQTGKVIFHGAGRECTLSVAAAEIFQKLGYADVTVCRNGIPRWVQKMQPLLAAASLRQLGA